MRHRALRAIFCVATLASTSAVCAGDTDTYNPDFDSVVVTPVRVTEDIYMLTGEGGNMGLNIGADGAFLIDDQYDEISDKILAAIAQVTDKSVRIVVNTHWHGDHVGANAKMKAQGAIIYAHDSVRIRMLEGQKRDERDTLFHPGRAPAAPQDLPIVTFNDSLHIYWNDEEIEVIHVNPAHTDGDAIIIFHNANVIHAGDLISGTSYPYIDLHSGGSIHGFIDNIELLKGLMDDQTKIIPGHGPLLRRDDVEKFLRMLRASKDRVELLKNEGRTLEEIQALNPVAEFDADYARRFIGADRWIASIFNSL